LAGWTVAVSIIARGGHRHARAGLLCLTGATGLEPATSGVTGDPTSFRLGADTNEVPAYDGFSSRCPDEPRQASDGGFSSAWTRCGHADGVFEVVIRVTDRGHGFEAELADYPVLREAGATPWEAVHRVVADHRALLERRWSAGALRS
jgi:hypothetical protein